MTHIDSLLAGAAVAALFNVLGHYIWRRPRRRLPRPWAYTYGVGSGLAGLAVYAGLSGDWPALVVPALVFAVSGSAIIGLYFLDHHTATRFELEDARAEVRALRARYEA